MGARVDEAPAAVLVEIAITIVILDVAVGIAMPMVEDAVMAVDIVISISILVA